MRVQRWKKILSVAWPLIIANSFWNIQMTIDRIYLGRFSTDALAAAIAVMGVFWAPMALVQQTAGYVTTFVAQLMGAQRPQEVGASVWQSIYVSVVGGLLFMLLIPVAPWLFELMGHAPNVRALEIEYFQSMCWAALPTALVAAASGFFTGLGNSAMVMWINGVGMALNVLLAYPMIFGKWGCPSLGIAGAGYAASLATWGGAIFGFSMVFREKYQAQYNIRSSWRLDWALMKRFLRYGVPSGAQFALEGLAFTVFLVIVGRMPDGDAALASSGIAVTVMMLAVLPTFGLAQAVAVMVGQSLGESKPDEAERSSWAGLQVAWMYIAVVAATFWLFPGFYLSWFHNEENKAVWDQVAVMVPYLLMFVGTFTIFDSANLVLSFAMKGAGDTRFVSAVALFMPWPLMIFPTWLFRDMQGAVYWAWGAASIYIITQAFVFWRRFEGGKWKSMRVIEH